MSEIDQVKAAEVEERRQRNEAKALGLLAAIVQRSASLSLITHPEKSTQPTRVEQTDPRTSHYGECPNCGRSLHKKGSKLICKRCGYKRRR